MHIITEKALSNFGKQHPQAAQPMRLFIQTLRRAEWRSLEETRSVLPHADQVTVKSGSVVTVFNVGGNNWRVITALHYNRQVVYILAVLTHAEYDRQKWKETL